MSVPALRALPDHLLPLGGSGDFAVWRTIALRGTGFPFDLLEQLADEDLSATVDQLDASAADCHDGAPLADLEQRHSRALEAAGAHLRAAASDERFLRAVIWQNPQLVRILLAERLREGAPVKTNNRWRKRNATLLGYLQRYAAKNDTIGFFGPVGWARWDQDAAGLEASYGPGLLAHQGVYFENWAIDLLALAISRRDGVREHLPYRRPPAIGVEGATAWRATGTPVELDPLEARLLRLADGARTAGDLARAVAASGPAGAGAGDVEAALARLERRGLLRRDLRVPLTARPEVALAERLEGLPVEGARRAAGQLRELVALRDRVAAAAGPDSSRPGHTPGPEPLLDALDALHARFEDLTGAEAERLPGTYFVGRTPLYTDARRAAEVTVGTAVLDEAAPALEGLLLAARWFAARLGRLLGEVARETFRDLARGAGGEPVPFPRLLFALNPVILRDSAGAIARAQRELAGRFREVTSSGVLAGDVLRVDPCEFLTRSRCAFGRPRPPWAVAHYHSPDVMIDAPDAAAVARGEYRIVLGELHAGMNTLQSRAFLTQSPDPDALQRCAEHDPTPWRIVPLFPKGWPRVTSRVFPPPTLVTSRSEYVAIGGDLGCEDLPAVPSGSLVAREQDGLVVVQTRDGAWCRPLLEVMSEFLSMATATRFSVMDGEQVNRRVEVGKVVVVRRTWRFVEVPAWVSAPTPAACFTAARAWFREQGFPRHVFVRLPGEHKPRYVDCASPLLVDDLARLLRRVHPSGERWAMTVAEMLPGPGGLWLSDAQGRRYTSELRLVAVDLGGTGADR